MLSKKQLKNSFSRKSIIDASSSSSLQLPDINERFVDACENGDINTVNNILNSIKDFNIEVTDNLGKTALRLAVENEHLEVIQALLAKSDSQKIRDALLLAIFMGHTSIAEAILKHPKYKILNEKKFLNGDTDSFWQIPSSDDAQFSPDITPIMLASQYNRTEIVQMLLLNGDRISKPHDFNCKCTECLNKFKFDSLRHAQSRLNAYRGLGSDSYISLASIDPILTAFELSHELGVLALKEKYFKHEYLQLCHSLSTYSVKLLNNVRGRDELNIVLNKTGREKDEKYEKLARLDLAIRFQEKPFVAHSNCQQKLIEIWYSGIRKITKMNPVFIFFLILLHIILLPISSIIYAIFPFSKFSKFLSLPLVKFISHLVSYLVFIGMIIASSLRLSKAEMQLEKFSCKYSELFKNYTEYINRSELAYQPAFTDFYIRPYMPSDLDIAISVWVLGHTWHELKKIFDMGMFNYLHSPNNVVNFIMIIFYIASYGLKYYTMVIISTELKNIESGLFWKRLETLNETDVDHQIKAFQTFYWLNSDRYYWFSFDPINLSEGLFGIGNVISFARLCFYLPISQQLGPLQITLGKMINDIIKFICIFLIIFASFVFSLNSLFWYYDKDVRKRFQVSEESKNICTTTKAEEAFGSLIRAFKTLFFAVYLIGDNKVTRIDPFKNSSTMNIGYLIYAMFHIACFTILMSMLIAMMTQSYQNIIHHSDTEWKFARSKLLMEYIKDGYTLPVPLNLIPTPVAVYFSFKEWYKKHKETKQSKESVSNPVSINVDEPTNTNECKAQIQLPVQGPAIKYERTISKNKKSESETTNSASIENQNLTYRIVMERVVKRYLMHNQGDSDDPKQSDLEEFKQDLQTMRYEMLNDMKKSKEVNLRNSFMINNSVQFVAEEIMNNYKTENKEILQLSVKRFKSLINLNQNLLANTESPTTNSQDETYESTFSQVPSEINDSSSANAIINQNAFTKRKNSQNNDSGESSFIHNNIQKNSPVSKVSFELFEGKLFYSSLQKIAEESNSEHQSKEISSNDIPGLSCTQIL